MLCEWVRKKEWRTVIGKAKDWMNKKKAYDDRA